MDLTAIAFYGIVCGCLSLFAPQLGGIMPRLAVGAGVGVVAAVVLPIVKTISSGY